MKLHTPKCLNVLIICILSFLSSLQLFAINDGSRYAESSVLSSGKWVQLKVTKNAIYKLTYEDIKKMGFSDPAKVSVYGYGGWMLDPDFSKTYVDDLPEVSVYLHKGADGVFNSGDYLLFYARGTVKWTYNSSGAYFQHENNPYSTYGSYFIGEKESGPKEMEIRSSANSPQVTITTFDDYFLHEVDSISVLGSGRELFGESFVGSSSSQTQTVSFSIPGITSDPGKACLSFAAAPSSTTPVSMFIDENRIMSLDIAAIVSSETTRKANLKEAWRAWDGDKKENTQVKITYNSTGQSVACLNFVALNVKRKLQYYNEAYTFFRSRESLNKVSQYVIANAKSSSLVWNITDNFDAYMISTSSDSEQLTFSESNSALPKEYVLLDLNKSFPTPEVIGEIKNQDLHALPQTDYVIIVPEVFMSQANKLAEFHRTTSNLHVTVVQDNWIFNEFSSGVRDATAFRRFMKMFYDRAQSDDEKPKYLLLFGDGIFDNRHITSEGKKANPKNLLLTYQVKESVSESTSYGTDDYFGFLDDREGNNIGGDKLDIGIGRFPVSSAVQAENAVNKIIAYANNTQYGNWKNKLLFAADDTDNLDIVSTSVAFCGHAKEADEVAEIVKKNYPEYMVSKFYMDAYKSELVNGKKTYPGTKKALFDAMKEGCFVFNYTGHGSAKALSSEDMMQISDVRNMKFENLPLWITATCDFGWFDAINLSAGEEAFLNKNSAAIALFTTTRVVYSHRNLLLNREFMKHLFLKINGEYPRLGDVIKNSKLAVGDDTNKLNYALFGDPALRLNYPEYKVELQEVNGTDVTSGDQIELKALDKVVLSGIITGEDGNKLENFNGTVRATIFDSKRTVQSIVQGNDDGHFSFATYPNIIYFGNTEVSNGSFSLNFNVPFDISYIRDNGLMNFYAYDLDSEIDAKGSFQNYVFAGTVDNPILNDQGPEIVEMFLNSPEFKNGDNLNETPYFYAYVFDEDGINMSNASAGHNIMISIDNNSDWIYPLNAYYQSQNAMEGSVGFSIPALPEGKHSLTFRVWDTQNNPTVDTLHFNVVAGLKPEIIDIYTLNNPVKTTARFFIEHDFPETVMSVEVRIYDLSGRAVWTHAETGSSGYLKSYPIDWDLVNNSGGRVLPGVYIYQAAVRTSSSKSVTKAKKIIVLGQ